MTSSSVSPYRAYLLLLMIPLSVRACLYFLALMDSHVLHLRRSPSMAKLVFQNSAAGFMIPHLRHFFSTIAAILSAVILRMRCRCSAASLAAQNLHLEETMLLRLRSTLNSSMLRSCLQAEQALVVLVRLNSAISRLLHLPHEAPCFIVSALRMLPAPQAQMQFQCLNRLPL